ncbi:hypothetical protein BT93_G1707 [Corymbia citriodora subsp. variegata]|nr:hypothetical protein BT93_G1707 [Corymbia citriodora subsp. variegata]
MKIGLGELGPAIRPPRLPAWKGNASSPPRPFRLTPPLPSPSLSGLGGGDTNRSFRVHSGVSKLLLCSAESTRCAPTPLPRVEHTQGGLLALAAELDIGARSRAARGARGDTHWAAKSLNFSRVAIFSVLCFSSGGYSVFRGTPYICLVMDIWVSVLLKFESNYYYCVVEGDFDCLRA